MPDSVRAVVQIMERFSSCSLPRPTVQGAGIFWIDFFIIYISFALFICACISYKWSIKTGPDEGEVGFQGGDQESLLAGGGFDRDLGRCLGV